MLQKQVQSHFVTLFVARQFFKQVVAFGGGGGGLSQIKLMFSTISVRSHSARLFGEFKHPFAEAVRHRHRHTHTHGRLSVSMGVEENQFGCVCARVRADKVKCTRECRRGREDGHRGHRRQYSLDSPTRQSHQSGATALPLPTQGW